MILVWLAEKIANELKDNYFDGNINRVFNFIKEAKEKKGFCFIRVDQLMCSPPNALDMLEQGISEIEDTLLAGENPNILNLKYAYLNLIEAYGLLKKESNNEAS